LHYFILLLTKKNAIYLLKLTAAMCFNKVIYLLLFIFFVSSAKAQDANMNTLDSFSAKFIATIRSTERERAFLVTDRVVFTAGEYIWFKTFLLGTVSQKPTTKSKYLFADIVNDKDSIIKRLILDATNRQLSSRISLPDSLPTGYYWLRAYTTQMAVHDTNEIAVKPLYVFGKSTDNIVVKTNKKATSTNDLPALTFYPEGGNIMTGINSIVGLQATNSTGEPLHVEGIIKDNRDTNVAKFTTNTNGLAKFEFEPSGYRKYRAVINWNGKETSYFLPPFNYHAGQISVVHQPGAYKLRILLGDSIFTKETPTYIVGISKDSLVFAGIGKGLCEVSVEESKLPPGITTFYLFSADFKPLSERSVYVNSNNLHVNVATDKSNYNKREKINLSLSITDAAQHAIPSLLAVSVSDSLFTNKQEPCNSNTSFNLQAVDNFSLANNTCFSDDDIDLMMLTKNNAYQTFNTAATSRTTIDDSLLYVKGTILSDKNTPLSDKSVMLLSNTGSNDLFLMDTTNYNGRFHFPLSHYPDSLQVALEIKDLNDNRIINSKVVLDAITFPKLTTPVTLKRYFDESPSKARQKINTYINALFFNAEGKPLSPVYVKTVADFDNSKRISPYSSILTSNDLDGRTSVDLAILKISGLQLLNGYLVIHGLNSFHSPGPASEPLLLVEGVEVPVSSDGIGNVSPVMSYLHALNPKDIDFIEVLKDGAAANYGVRGANGVILVNLTNKVRDLPGNANNMKVFYLKGITNAGVFPAISYDHKDKKAAATTDARSTIFWNGNFYTAGADNAILTLYSSDVPATYNITVTGITAKGDIIYKTISIQSR
jgi:TonB-dependent SusC/RagA subfamily outer membrane receptor